MNVRGNGISPRLELDTSDISSLEPDVVKVSSDVEKVGGEGKEWDCVCLHECVASCFGSW